MSHLDPTKPFMIKISTLFAKGAVLSQHAALPQNLLHHCAFYSWKLTLAEKNYHSWDKELQAIKKAFEEWHHLLEGV